MHNHYNPYGYDPSHDPYYDFESSRQAAYMRHMEEMQRSSNRWNQVYDKIEQMNYENQTAELIDLIENDPEAAMEVLQAMSEENAAGQKAYNDAMNGKDSDLSDSSESFDSSNSADNGIGFGLYDRLKTIDVKFREVR